MALTWAGTGRVQGPGFRAAPETFGVAAQGFVHTCGRWRHLQTIPSTPGPPQQNPSILSIFSQQSLKNLRTSPFRWLQIPRLEIKLRRVDEIQPTLLIVGVELLSGPIFWRVRVLCCRRSAAGMQHHLLSTAGRRPEKRLQRILWRLKITDDIASPRCLRGSCDKASIPGRSFCNKHLDKSRKTN